MLKEPKKSKPDSDKKAPSKNIKLDTPKDAPDKNTKPAAQDTNQQTSSKKDNVILKPMENKDKKPSPFVPIILALVVVLVGTGSGYGLAQVFGTPGKTTKVTKTTKDLDSGTVAVGDIVGSPDKDTFKDSAEGVLVKGGIEGEGSHHLLRPGGIDQNVYLTSSVLDLDKLEGHKIKVWGETFAAQKAGWLMDVGRAEVLELDAQKPFEEE